jgi:hypothetical protein
MREHTETEGALAAMSRAAVTARARASLFGSKLVLWRDGSVVLVDPRKNSAEQGGTDLPATAPESKPGGNQKPQPAS